MKRASSCSYSKEENKYYDDNSSWSIPKQDFKIKRRNKSEFWGSNVSSKSEYKFNIDQRNEEKSIRKMKLMKKSYEVKSFDNL